jgi:MOSC domain-containing protein YiiM
MAGRLIGIARAQIKRGPMEALEAARVTVEAGVEGDRRGVKPGRQVTVLFREGWEDACRDLGEALPWTTRRANLYLEGVEGPRATGGRIVIGPVVLEVVEEVRPCLVMEQARRGLKQAMTPDWRGGVACSVIHGGRIALGDAAEVG